MRWSTSGTKLPTNLFEAACWHYALKPVCRCGHSATFDPHGLWWHFERRSWSDSLVDVRQRMWCRICRSAAKRKVRPLTIEAVQESEADIVLPLPPKDVWRRMVQRMRY